MNEQMKGEVSESKAAAAQEAVEFDYPEFHHEGMGCGLEDRGITDRYEAMRYGFDEALDQMAAILNSLGPLYASPVAAAPVVDVAILRALADRWATDRSYTGSPVDDIRALIEQPTISTPASSADSAVLTNPYTGQPRDYRDVESDPAGTLIVEPGKPLEAASTSAAPGIDLDQFRESVIQEAARAVELWMKDGISNEAYAESKAKRDRLLALIDATPKANAPRGDLVPGVVRCAKCSFQLHRTNLYLGSGTTGPGDSKTEPCPNGCGPLWPVTWQTWATEGWQQAERYHEELRQLQDSPKGGSDAWQPMDAAPKSVADGERVEGIYLLGFIHDADLVDPQAGIDVIWWEPLLPNSKGGRGKWCANRFGEECEVVPTKWQHLPEVQATSAEVAS